MSELARCKPRAVGSLVVLIGTERLKSMILYKGKIFLIFFFFFFTPLPPLLCLILDTEVILKIDTDLKTSLGKKILTSSRLNIGEVAFFGDLYRYQQNIRTNCVFLFSNSNLISL